VKRKASRFAPGLRNGVAFSGTRPREAVQVRTQLAASSPALGVSPIRGQGLCRRQRHRATIGVALGIQPGEFLSQQPRGSGFNRLNHPMHSELRIDIKQNANVVEHDLALMQEAVRFRGNLSYSLLEPLINASNQDRRRYFGQKTTYLHEKTTFRLDR
jgi:hypothetical protein